MHGKMIIFALAVASAVSQCPPTTSPPPKNGNSANGNLTCKNVTTFNWDLDDMFESQPEYYTVFPNTSRFNQIDNVCVTMFLNPSDTYIIYIAFVYLNGTCRVDTYIGENVEVGTYVLANAKQTSTRYNLGYAGCGTYVYYGCGNYGGFDQFPLASGSGNETGPLPSACQQEVHRIVEANGLPYDDLYFPPYALPTRCVTQQQCGQATV